MRWLRKISSQEEAECIGPGVGGEMDMEVGIGGRFFFHCCILSEDKSNWIS